MNYNDWDGSVLDCGNSSAFALELPQFSTEPSIGSCTVMHSDLSYIEKIDVSFWYA